MRPVGPTAARAASAETRCALQRTLNAGTATSSIGQRRKSFAPPETPR